DGIRDFHVTGVQTCALPISAAETDRFGSAWCSWMPTVAHVVKRVVERDNITIRGRPPAEYVTEYEYRDPVFEGRQREFRGFARADRKSVVWGRDRTSWAVLH